MRQAIERILHVAGHNAKVNESAEAVVDMEAVMTADCLILDIELPGTDRSRTLSNADTFRTVNPGILSPCTTGKTCVTKPNDWEQRIT